MKRKRRNARQEQSEEEAFTWLGIIVLLAMGSIAAGAIAWGCHRKGFDWTETVSAASCLAAGIAFVAIGMFELEWLERIVGFVDGIVTGVEYWLWTSWFGTLSDSEFVGRSRARAIWVVVGTLTYFAGCVLALRLF